MKPSDILFREYGGKGATRVLNDFGAWYKQIYHAKKNGNMGAFEKATVADGPNAGFLIPDGVVAETCRVMHLYGRILKRANQVTVPLGGKVTLNDAKASVEAGDPAGDCTAIVSIVQMVLNPVPVVLRPKFTGAIVEVSNELLANSSFGQLVFDMLVDSLVGKEEQFILSSVATSTLLHDGIFADANVNTATPVDFSSSGSLPNFVYESIVNHDGLSDVSHGLIIGPPWMTTKMLGSYGMSCGPDGPRFLCYDVIQHRNSVKNEVGLPWYVAMVDDRSIVYATSGDIIVDINIYSGHSKNCSALKIGQGFDFGLCNSEKMTKAEVL